MILTRFVYKNIEVNCRIVFILRLCKSTSLTVPIADWSLALFQAFLLFSKNFISTLEPQGTAAIEFSWVLAPLEFPMPEKQRVSLARSRTLARAKCMKRWKFKYENVYSKCYWNYYHKSLFWWLMLHKKNFKENKS